uniref:Uncharacterized protein n=1 Tax=Oryza sativa subsp. japonica TaxID=39947 RepID=Q5VPT8_ORYSJ|nr:hypothetical protein [Oryza sativa Japonica Group]
MCVALSTTAGNNCGRHVMRSRCGCMLVAPGAQGIDVNIKEMNAQTNMKNQQHHIFWARGSIIHYSPYKLEAQMQNVVILASRLISMKASQHFEQLEEEMYYHMVMLVGPRSEYRIRWIIRNPVIFSQSSESGCKFSVAHPTIYANWYAIATYGLITIRQFLARMCSIEVGLGRHGESNSTIFLAASSYVPNRAGLNHLLPTCKQQWYGNLQANETMVDSFSDFPLLFPSSCEVVTCITNTDFTGSKRLSAPSTLQIQLYRY